MNTQNTQANATHTPGPLHRGNLLCKYLFELAIARDEFSSLERQFPGNKFALSQIRSAKERCEDVLQKALGPDWLKHVLEIQNDLERDARAKGVQS